MTKLRDNAQNQTHSPQMAVNDQRDHKVLLVIEMAQHVVPETGNGLAQRFRAALHIIAIRPCSRSRGKKAPALFGKGVDRIMDDMMIRIHQFKSAPEFRLNTDELGKIVVVLDLVVALQMGKHLAGGTVIGRKDFSSFALAIANAFDQPFKLFGFHPKEAVNIQPEIRQGADFLARKPALARVDTGQEQLVFGQAGTVGEVKIVFGHLRLTLGQIIGHFHINRLFTGKWESEAWNIWV